MIKTETLYRHYTNDCKIVLDVTAIKTRSTLLASVSYKGNELAHRFFDCSSHDTQNEEEVLDNAIAWCLGAKEFYDALDALFLIRKDEDEWTFEDDDEDMEKKVEQAEYYEER